MTSEADKRAEELLMEIEDSLEALLLWTEDRNERAHLLDMYRTCMMTLIERRERMEEEE